MNKTEVLSRYHGLGMLTRALHDAKGIIDDGSNRVNPFIKIIPTFVSWIQNDQSERIIEYCKKRYDLYKESGFYKRNLGSDTNKGENWIKLASSLKQAKKLLEIVPSKENSNRGTISFVLGFFHFLNDKEMAFPWVTNGTALDKHAVISCLLGSFVKEVALLQEKIIGNRGLIKQFLNFLKMTRVSDLDRVFTQAYVTLFRIMLKTSEDEIRGYLITTLAEVAKRLVSLDEFEEIDIEWLKAGFITGMLSFTSIKNVLEARKKRNEKRDDNQRRRFLLPHNDMNLMSFELGKLFHVYSLEELNTFKSRRYAKIVPNSRSLNVEKILRLFNYIGTTAIRLIMKQGVKDGLRYPFQKTVMSLAEYIITLDGGKIEPNQASMSFIMGYHDYWKPKITKEN